VSEEEQNLYTFYETLVFTRRLDTLASLETLYAIQADLLADPERWPIVKGTNGARKGRVADPDSTQGKRGSFRYLYFYLEHRGQIYLLFLFAKTAQANLSAEQLKYVAEVVAAIKRELA
jgi:hypothetical protein